MVASPEQQAREEIDKLLLAAGYALPDAAAAKLKRAPSMCRAILAKPSGG